VAKQNTDVEGLCNSLERKDFLCSFVPDEGKIVEQIAENPPDLVIVENSDPVRLNELARLIKKADNPPVIALLEAELLGSASDFISHIDDFVLRPYRLSELETRIKRLLRNETKGGGAQIKQGDLVIDLEKCEVTIAGRPVLLTFKEYELIKFLAGNPERVFSRDALLNKVWGYEYYGGDRTVDVHIKRLRSKIEDAGHTFVETVRNIGYRFKAN
jgi:DNA-binding response OmpR family regulator